MKISVSVTTFNHERFIRQAVESVLSQACSAEIEVVVGDDCSTDGTGSILADLERQHGSRLKIIRPKRNLGRNGCPMFLETLRHCDGDFVAMFDGDDYWTSPDKLEQQLDFFHRHPECSLCHHAVESVFADGQTQAWQADLGTEESVVGFESLLPYHYIASPAPMVRREVVRTLPRWVKRAPFGDWPIYLHASDLGRIGYIPRTMAAYRFHGGGVWTQATKVQRLQQVVDFFASIGGGTLRRHPKELFGALCVHLLELAGAHCEQGTLVDRKGVQMKQGFAWHPFLDIRKGPWRVSPAFLRAALQFLEQVGGEFAKANARSITRVRSALHFQLAEELRTSATPGAARHAALSLWTSPSTFLLSAAG